MVSRGYKLEFAEQIFRQIEGFGEYGFPESHAASFALLVYVSAWIKCHEPAAFLGAMLNSLPMGFYSASQLIQDAKRHGVHIRPVDVTVSEWECTLEEQNDDPFQSIASTAPALSMSPAVRLGLNRVKGMGREAATRIMEARKISPFENTGDLASRALLNATEIRALAGSDALLALSGHRRQTLWAVASHIRQQDMMRGVPVREALPIIPAAPEGEEIRRIMQHGAHPARHPWPCCGRNHRDESVRPWSWITVHRAGWFEPRHRNLPPAARHSQRRHLHHPRRRDRNNQCCVMEPAYSEISPRSVGRATVDGVWGWQPESGVKHVIAKRLVDHSHLLGNLTVKSRNFV